MNFRAPCRTKFQSIIGALHMAVNTEGVRKFFPTMTGVNGHSYSIIYAYLFVKYIPTNLVHNHGKFRNEILSHFFGKYSFRRGTFSDAPYIHVSVTDLVTIMTNGMQLSLFACTFFCGRF